MLDVDHQVREGLPEIRLWSITDRGERVLILERGFHGYFYAVPGGGCSTDEAKEEIARIDKSSLLTGLEVVDRRLFGRQMSAVKVSCRDPEAMRDYAQRVSRLDCVEKCLEQDIRYSMRYMIDNDLEPCGWHEVEVDAERRDPEIQVDSVYLAKSRPRRIKGTEAPRLRILAFSAVFYSPKGSPKPERNPVVMISTFNDQGEEKRFVADDEDDGPVMESFAAYVRRFDPDIIVGYQSNRELWPYLMSRCEKLGVSLETTRTGTSPHMSVFGHVSVTGRANVDPYDFIRDIAEIKLKTLENVAEYFGLSGLKERVMIETTDVAAYWEEKERRPDLVNFSSQNARWTMEVARALFDFAIQLSRVVGLPLDHVGTAAVGFRVEWHLLREARKRGELIPGRVERPYRPYAGAVVLEPGPGLHDDIAVIDFKALYPSLMMANNISPDTYISPDEPQPPSGVHIAPEVGHMFRKEPPGFYNRVLSKLIEVRDDVRRGLEVAAPDSAEYRLLDARQRALKVITNAVYGYTGWLGARWYVRPVAEATTAWGRQAMLEALSVADELGMESIYGDTDSVFVKYDQERVRRFLEEAKNRLGLEMKVDKVYRRVLFTEAKKRYCGLLPDGRLDVVGLEVVRGDWPVIARDTQRGVLEIVLSQEPHRAIGLAKDFVRQRISQLRAGDVLYRHLIIWKELTRPIEAYKARTAHVEAAKLMRADGWELDPGDKVGYIIGKGEGKLYEKALPHFMASLEDIDFEYYVKKQVLPAALRVLEPLGVKEKDLINGSGGKLPFS